MTNPIDEIIRKLNDWCHDNNLFTFEREMLHEAASALTSLQERIRKLEDALADILSAPSIVEAYGSICRARDLLSGAGE